MIKLRDSTYRNYKQVFKNPSVSHTVPYNQRIIWRSPIV
jgi:hypothetical protein